MNHYKEIKSKKKIPPLSSLPSCLLDRDTTVSLPSFFSLFFSLL